MAIRPFSHRPQSLLTVLLGAVQLAVEFGLPFAVLIWTLPPDTPESKGGVDFVSRNPL